MNLRKLNSQTNSKGEKICKHTDLIFLNVTMIQGKQFFIYHCNDCNNKIRKNAEERLNDKLSSNIFETFRDINCNHVWIKNGCDTHYICSKCYKTANI